MNFSEKLKKAAKELNLTQVQMAGMTGKSKASISQYLAGKQIPPEEQQRDIAVALGLKEDYFSKADDRMPALSTQKAKDCIIPRLSVMDAARMMGINHQTVRKGLQQGVFPWGYGAEAFADMTVNLPGYSLDPGEAFISGDISKDLLRFIKENKLGKVLPYQVQSGYGKYSAVAFDLEKLKAFDPKGVAELRKEWNLPDKKPVKKKSRGMER